jgi:hypothetical protein
MLAMAVRGVRCMVFFLRHDELRFSYPYRVYSGLLYIPP